MMFKRKTMMFKRKSDEAGSILLWVMVVGLFAVGSLGAMLRLIPAGMRYTLQDAATTYAFIAAESGIHYVMDQVRIKGPTVLNEIQDRWFALSEDASFDGRFVIKTDDQFVYVTGEFRGATRTLRANASALKGRARVPKSHFRFDVAAYALGGPGAKYPVLKYSGGANIRGKSGTNSVEPGAVKLEGGPSILGDILVGPVSSADASSVVSNPDWIKVNVLPGTIREYPLPEFREELFRNLPPRGSVETQWDQKVIVIDSPGSYDSIVAGSGDYSIVFDTKDKDLYVRTKTLKAHGSGRIEVRGTGRLFLYVDQSLKLQGSGALVHDGDPMKAVLYYAGSSKLTLGGGTRFRGVIYAKDAEVDIGEGFNAAAWILSGGRKVTFGGGANLGDVGVVYAPMAHIEVKGGAVTGIVIGNSVHVSGGATLTHHSIDFDYLPPELSFDDELEDDGDDVETLQWHLCWSDCGPAASE